jgi:hypothetical protein
MSKMYGSISQVAEVTYQHMYEKQTIFNTHHYMG